jgi:hypothetical protein
MGSSSATIKGREALCAGRCRLVAGKRQATRGPQRAKILSSDAHAALWHKQESLDSWNSVR